MLVDIDILENKINQLKRELIQVVKSTGLNSSASLRCSQELDQHITKYQQLQLTKIS
jgi:hypothetical protein